jgi:hypothetical protein
MFLDRRSPGGDEQSPLILWQPDLEIVSLGDLADMIIPEAP